MPTLIDIPGRGRVRFPDGVSDEEIKAALAREFPPTGKDIYEHAAANPKYIVEKMTEDDFKLYKQYKGEKNTDWLDTFAAAAGYAGGALAGAVGAAATSPAKSIQSIPTSFVVGTTDLIDFGKSVFGDNNLENLKRGARWAIEREETVKAAPSPEFVEGASFVTDPTMFIPGINVARAGSKFAAVGLKAASKGAHVVESLGQKVSALAHMPENLAARATLAVTDDAAMAQKAASLVSQGSLYGAGADIALGVSVPGLASVATPIVAGKVAGKAISTVGEAGAHLFDSWASGPQRLGAFERLAADTAAGAGARALGKVGAKFGADTAAELAGSAIKGSAEGALIGGVLGGLANGEEGFFQGLGAGMTLGAFGGVVGRGVMKLSGADHAAGVAANLANVVAGRGDGVYMRAFAERAKGVNEVAKMLDLTAHAESLGVRVVFHDNNSLPGDPALVGQKYAGATVKADSIKPATVYLNVDNIRDGVVPHEVFHAIATEGHLKQLRDTLLGERVGGEVIRPGVFSENDFKQFAEAYMQKLSVENRAVMQSQLVTALDKSAAPAARWDAQRAIVDEVGASYAQAWAKAQKADTFLAGRIPTIYSQLVSLVSDKVSNKLALGAQRSGFDFSKGVDAGFSDASGKRVRVPELDKMVKSMFVPGKAFEPAKTNISLGRNLAESMALVRAIGAEDLVVATKSGARLKTKDELKAENLRHHAVITSRLAAVPKDQQGGARIIADVADRSSGTARNEDVHIFSRENPASSAQIEAIVGSGIYNQAQIDHIRRAFQSMSRGDVHEVGYLKATEGGKAGVFEHSMREMLPYSIEVNKANVLYFRSVDITKVRSRLDAAFARPEFKGVYGSKGEAWSALSGEYLRNLSEASSLPSADVLGGGALGEKRRNFFYEVMGTVPRKDTVLANPAREGYMSSRKGGSVYESFRFERVTSMVPTAEAVPFSAGRSYQKSQINYLPDDEASQPAFYSRLTRTIEQSPQNKASGAQWKATIKNSKLGANADEMALVGVGDLEDGKTYSKQDVLDYLRANEVVVKDVTLGEKKIEISNQLQFYLDNHPQEGGQPTRSQDWLKMSARLERRAKEFQRNSGRNADAYFALAEEANRIAENLEVGQAESQTHFSQYQLPGAKEGSYREVLLTVPQRNPFDVEGYNKAATSEVRERIRNAPTGETWQDGHSQYSAIANPIVRLRLNERTTADGKRMLFLEEVQAPQKGQFEKMPALFQKNWREIAFKWALRKASEEGYDSVGWTTGEQQAARYDLSKQISKIEYRVSGDQKYRIRVFDKNGSSEMSANIPTTLDANGVEDYVGKDMAKKIVDSATKENQTLSGLDLKVGGEGLKKLYDVDFRNVVNGLPAVKKSGQKVGTAEIQGTNPGVAEKGFTITQSRTGRTWTIRKITQDPAYVGDGSGGLVGDVVKSGFSSRQEAARWADENIKIPAVSIHSLDLAPPIRESVMGGQARFLPSSLTARDINEIAAEVGGGDVKGGAKAFGAFMRSMRDKGITLRDVVKSYGITLSSIQRQELLAETIKRNWPDAPFKDGTKVRPEDAFAQLLGTPEGQRYLDAAERGVFDEQAADTVVQKFRSFGFHNKLKEQMKTAVEQFYPKAQDIIDAVNSMPADEFVDYVRNNFKGISYGKVGFWSGQLGRGDIPTFDSRQGKLIYGKEVPVTKQVLLEQRDRLTQLGIKVSDEFKEFAQTLLHHEVWDRLNDSDTEHGPIKEAMLRFLPADTDYLAAVKSGDMETAQKMVDEAAKKAGYDLKAFHGTGESFTKVDFKKGSQGLFWFASDAASITNGESGAGRTSKIMPLLIKLKNPAGWSEYDKMGIGELRRAGYDGAILRESDGSFNGFAFDKPSQIKSADPITRDAKGNVIPLSKRFNTTSEDIRYMPADENANYSKPPREADAKEALYESKRPFWGIHRGIDEGSPVGVRIDIPAYTQNGIYVQTVHKPATPGNVGDRIGYDNAVRLSGPVRFFVKEGSDDIKSGALAIKENRAKKHPIATVEGGYMRDRATPSDINSWTAVGMNPAKHSYFYDKLTGEPVVGGSESYSVGNTVFVKDPVYGSKGDYRYMPVASFDEPMSIGSTTVRNHPAGYRTTQREGGAVRLYGKNGALLGVHGTVDEANGAVVKAERLGQVRLEKVDPRTSEVPPAYQKSVAPEDRVIRKTDEADGVIRESSHLTESGAPAPDTKTSSIPTSGVPIKWADSARFIPVSERDAFSDMTPALLNDIERQTPTIAGIHIDRMRVGTYKGEDLQGGMFYPTIQENLGKRAVWAFNSPGVARAVARRAAANGGYVKLILMQEGNVIGNKTFTKIWFNELAENIGAGRLSERRALSELNRIRTLNKKETGHSTPWTSLAQAKSDIIEMPQIKRGASYFMKSLRTTKTEGTKVAYESLLAKKMSDAGFPDAKAIVDAIEEPAFKNVPKGASVAILKIDPIKSNTEIATAKSLGIPEHTSYKYVLQGEPVARLTHYNVVDDTFPDTKNKIWRQQAVDYPLRRAIATAKSAAGKIDYSKK